VDIAMFCIYSLYDKAHIDNLIETYFKMSGKKLDENTRTKIYCYVAACGLLWSNWCEYKSTLGVEFGEYSLLQYRYAKDFYKIVKERIGSSAVQPE
jgi:thiamine kinase-like enzyme